MSVTGEAPQVSAMVVQAATWFGGLITSGVLLGLLDRWMKARADARGDKRQDGRELDDAQQRHLANVERDRDQARKERDEAEERREAAELERGRVWRAGRRMEDFAHKQMHQANNRIQKAFQAGRRLALGETLDSKGQAIDCPPDMPEPPPLESFMPAAAEGPHPAE